MRPATTQSTRADTVLPFLRDCFAVEFVISSTIGMYNKCSSCTLIGAGVCIVLEILDLFVVAILDCLSFREI